MQRPLKVGLCNRERSRGDLGYSSLQYLESWGKHPQMHPQGQPAGESRLVLWRLNTPALIQLEPAVLAGETSNRIKWKEETPNRPTGEEALWEKGDSVRSPAQLPRGTLHSGPVARKEIWAESPKLKPHCAEWERKEVRTIGGWEATEAGLYECAVNIKLCT